MDLNKLMSAKPADPGNGPPQDLSPSQLWVALTALPRPHKILDYPRNDPETGKPIGQFAICPLSQAESMACQAAAEAFAKKLLKTAPNPNEENRGYSDIYNNEATCAILFRACRRADNVNLPLFPSVEAIRDKILDTEIAVLMNLYLQVRNQLGPFVETMSSEEVDAWIERLAKAGDSFPLSFLSQGAIQTLVMSLVARLSS